jgi:hypothetical protein
MLEDALASGFGAVEELCNACAAEQDLADGECAIVANDCL